MQKHLMLVPLLVGICSAAPAASAIATRLDDPKAVYLTAPEFGAHGDGTADDSAAIQAAIERPRTTPAKASCSCRRPLPADAHHLRVAGRARLRLRRDAARLRACGQHAGVSEGHRRHGDVHRRAGRRGRRCRRHSRAVSAARQRPAERRDRRRQSRARSIRR